MKTLIATFTILDIWMIIVILFSAYTVRASNLTTEHKKATEYTYQQGLKISLSISTCLMNDSGVILELDKSLDRFEAETGTRDLTIMALTFGISQEYGLNLSEMIFTKEGTKHFVKTLHRCGKLYE